MQIGDADLDYYASAAYGLSIGDDVDSDKEASSKTWSKVRDKGKALPGKTAKARRQANSAPPPGLSMKKKEADADVNLKKSRRSRRRKGGDGPSMTLDGKVSPAIRIVSPDIDSTQFSEEELRTSGMLAGIAPRTAGQNWPRAALATPEGMETTYKRTPALGGFVREEVKKEIYVDLPHWITLRESYLQQLGSLVHAMSSDSTQAPGDGDRRHFILLLVAYRKVTIRILGEFRFQQLQLHQDLANVKTANDTALLQPLYDAVTERSSYINSIADSLNWLDIEPFVSWIGLSTSWNPLLTPTRLDGSPAVRQRTGQGAGTSDIQMPRELVLSENDAMTCSELNATLWQLHSTGSGHGRPETSDKRSRPARANDGDDDPFDESIVFRASSEAPHPMDHSTFRPISEASADVLNSLSRQLYTSSAQQEAQMMTLMNRSAISIDRSNIHRDKKIFGSSG